MGAVFIVRMNAAERYVFGVLPMSSISRISPSSDNNTLTVTRPDILYGSSTSICWITQKAKSVSLLPVAVSVPPLNVGLVWQSIYGIAS